MTFTVELKMHTMRRAPLPNQILLQAVIKESYIQTIQYKFAEYPQTTRCTRVQIN